MDFGKIDFWNDDKGYGFISPDNGGRNVFLHIKSFKRYSRRPETGEMVSYDTTVGDRGLRAANVQYMEEKSFPSLVMFEIPWRLKN